MEKATLQFSRVVRNKINFAKQLPFGHFTIRRVDAKIMSTNRSIRLSMSLTFLWTIILLLAWRVTSDVPFQHVSKHTGNYEALLRKNSTKNGKSKHTGTLPTIFIIGSQKGGSSSLYELMVEHPQICRGLHKELHYFDHLNNYAEGTEFYRLLFQNPKCDGIVGAHFVDATPIIHDLSTWKRIYETYSGSKNVRDNLKFIVLLREPVSRDYSWYQHMTRTGRILKFKDHLVQLLHF